MNRLLLIVAILLSVTTSAAAQTEGKVSVGGSVSFVKPASDELNGVVSVGPVVRLNPRRGWGPAAALNWFRTDLRNPSGDTGDFARLRVRPLLAGVAYTVGSGAVLTSFSVVAGPSFNRIEFDDAFLDRRVAGAPAPTIDVENSVAVRPGVSVTWTVAPRVALIGFGGYFITRPDTVYRDQSGAEFRNRWKADSVVLSVGAVYSLF